MFVHNQYTVLFKHKNIYVYDRITKNTVVCQGHTETVRSVCISPDCNYVISGSWDKTVRVWDILTGACVWVLKGHTDWVNSVGVTNYRIISGSSDRTVRVWNMATGECIFILEGHIYPISSVCVTPKYVIYGSADHTRVWDWDSGQCVHMLDGVYEPLCITPNNRYIITRDATVRIWDVDTGKCVRDIVGHPNRILSSICATNCYIIVSNRIWDIGSGECVRVLNVHYFEFMCTTPDCNYIIFNLLDGTTQVWSLLTYANTNNADISFADGRILLFHLLS